ncbi:MAG: CAP domain-containing protein [Acetivibrio ethanolgignens]
MKRKLIKTTIALSLVMAVSAPTAAFAGTDCSPNLLKSYSIKLDGGKMQFVPQNTIKDNCQLSDILCGIKGWQENCGTSNGTNGNTGNNGMEAERPEEDKENAAGTENNTAQGYEMQVVQLVNQERAKAGLSPLAYNEKLSRVADLKAADMRDNNYFSHNSPTYGSPFDMMKSFGISYKAAGENIAKGQKTPQSVMNAWMNSSGHRANILNSQYEQIGIGYETDQKGNTYWVQMFIK